MLSLIGFISSANDIATKTFFAYCEIFFCNSSTLCQPSGCQKTYPFSAFLSMEEVDAFYPMTFSDRIDKILLAISKRTSYVGDTVAYSVNEMTSLLFVNRYGDDNQPLENHQIECQRSHLANYLRERKFANITYDNQSKLYLVWVKSIHLLHREKCRKWICFLAFFKCSVFS